MKLKKYGVRALLFVLALIVSLAVPSGTASATSPYDGIVTLTDQVRLEQNSSHGSGRADISSNWRSIFSNCDNWTSGSGSYAANCATANAALSAAFTQGYGWAVVQRTVKQDVGLGDTALYVGDKFVTIVVNPESNANAVFRDSYFGQELHVTGSSYTYGFNIVLNNDSNPVPVVTNGQKTTSFSSDFTILDDSDAFNYWSSDVYFSNIPTTYPSGYAGVQIPIEPPAAKYVAMGDSYSSGEGNPAFEYGTDQDSDLCHRSTSAYPRQIQNTLNLGATAFVACSGAVSDYVINDYNQENVELPQAAFVSEATKLITITIGGNDVGFAGVLTTCTLPTTESGTTEEKHQIEHDACIQAIIDARTIASGVALRTKLETLFSGLRSLGGQDLQVVAAGYPNLFPTFGDITGTCTWGNGYIGTSGRVVANDEVQDARLLHDDLNSTIDAAVTATGDDHIHFVDPTSAFSGHELCRATPWIYNAIPDAMDVVNRRGSYHPNPAGQVAYAGVIEGMVNSFS